MLNIVDQWFKWLNISHPKLWQTKYNGLFFKVQNYQLRFLDPEKISIINKEGKKIYSEEWKLRKFIINSSSLEEAVKEVFQAAGKLNKEIRDLMNKKRIT